MKKRWILAYVILLAASTVVRWQAGNDARPLAGQQVIRLPVFDQGRETGAVVDMVYVDLVPPGKPDAPGVLLLHGVPMMSYDLRGLAEILHCAGY
ncbi:MAG: hypothetical protein KDL10_10925, partial [Kiritimatiellae bacterium]|nr:hypothetical protein [Kiritimatiellia bacterium]